MAILIKTPKLKRKRHDLIQIKAQDLSVEHFED